MSEKDTIDFSLNQPATIESLIQDFQSLGIKPGMTLLVHSSLSSIGWVCGGAVSVIIALESVLTTEGTLVMPAHSGDYSDPSNWGNPAVPESWWPVIREQMPAYDKTLTPTRGIGIIPEIFRTQKGVQRSSHPVVSFAAWGKHKDYILQDEKLDFAMNIESPLGRIYELDGSILLLGVGYESNTSLHLAEYQATFQNKNIVQNGSPIFRNAHRVWATMEDIEFNEDDFGTIGREFEKENSIVKGMVGKAETRLINQKELVDFSTKWMTLNRK